MAGYYVYVKDKKTVAGGSDLWPEEKKLEVATFYLKERNISLVARITGVPRETIKAWRETKWWPELIKDLQDTQRSMTKQKLQKLIDSSGEILVDRLQNGDYQYDPKSGKVIRVPVKLKDAGKILKDMQDIVTGIEVQEHQEEQNKHDETVSERLLAIAEAFSNMRTRKDLPKSMEKEVFDDCIKDSPEVVGHIDRT